uniref:CSON011542 protein n=1 Tax=Culicoides sonorensis TaxID=179676 RepID=A0A336KJ03_CULSO
MYEDLMVRTGSSKWNESGVVYRVKLIIIHPDYRRETLDFDFSLFELETPIVFDDFTRPVTLVDENYRIRAGTMNLKMGSKKHKKHKSERKEQGEGYDYRPHGLKLILKVAGSSSTPEHGNDSPMYPPEYSSDFHEKHKKSKKKKKKKDREKRHKHHKEKRRHREDESSQEDFSINDESSQTPFYANLTTTNSIASKPLTQPMIPLKSPETSICSEKPKSELIDDSRSPLGFLQSPTTSLSSYTSKLEIPKPDSSRDSMSPSRPLSESGREPRSCVLKVKQKPLAKLLEHLIKALEKRDPHQFFAWPVTDEIAPNYSSIISKPMDFSTIRQKIEENEYKTIAEFTEDFKLMCDNALKYNHPETVYHKAAKRLLHVGMRLLQPENLIRTLRPLMGFMRELSPGELGFELPIGDGPEPEPMNIDSADEAETAMKVASAVDEGLAAQEEEDEKRKQIRLENNPTTKFEPFVDDMTADEILKQVQTAAKNAKNKLLDKKKAHKMGFIRLRRDGTTSMQILLDDDNEGPEKVISLGSYTGKLKQGTGQLFTFREDRRNEAKPVKPLYYGAFSSFAPIFDSRFANLSKEESDLISSTYGDDTGADYAKSIMEFSRDSPYASILANGLLDLLTNGEHRKTLETLIEGARQRHDKKEIDKSLPDTEEEIKRKYGDVKVDFDNLRSLGELGIETEFLDDLEMQTKLYEFQKKLQNQLENNFSLIEQLHQAQNQRLSQPPPMHLAHIQHAGPEEVELANQITANIADIAKQLPPGALTTPHALRKAMGLTNVGLENYNHNEAINIVPPLCMMNPKQQSTNQEHDSNQDNSNNGVDIDTTEMDMDLEDTVTNSQQVDIDTELRDILNDL